MQHIAESQKNEILECLDQNNLVIKIMLSFNFFLIPDKIFEIWGMYIWVGIV